MNYIEEIESEIEVPAIWMKDIHKRCRDCSSKEYIKKQWEFLQGLKKFCSTRGGNTIED